MPAKKENKSIKLPSLPYGEGSMSIRPDGSIMYRKRLGNPKKEFTVYGNTPKECMDKMRQKESELQKNIDSTDSDKTMLSEEMSKWLETVKKPTLKEQAYRRINGTVKQISKSDIGCLRYKQITSNEIQNMINKLVDDKYSHSTIKKNYDALNEFYRYYSAKDKFDNPMLFVVMPKKDNIKVETKTVEFFEQDDINKFVEECGAKYNTGNLKYKYGYALAANIYLGMRIGELLALQWSDIDFENNTIYISKTLIEINNPDYDDNNVELMKIKGIKKTKNVVQNSTKKSKNRYVPMNTKAKDLLIKHKKNSEFTEPDDFVISTRNRKTTTTKNISDTIKQIELNAGTKVQAPGTHVLRHTCASLYFRKHVPIETICTILGNTREVCEKTYIHFVEEQLKDAASKIDVIEI